MIPEGCTHYAKFYTDTTHYKLSEGLHYNTVIGHPTECWQKYNIWHYWENGKWVGVGNGFSDRMCKKITELENEEV
jgi:hypothetical protein